MDPLVRISKVELIPNTAITDKVDRSKELFTMKIQTCVVSENELLIQTMHVSNVLTVSCTCLECGKELYVKPSLHSHMRRHLQCVDDHTDVTVKTSVNRKLTEISVTEKPSHDVQVVNGAMARFDTAGVSCSHVVAANSNAGVDNGTVRVETDEEEILDISDTRTCGSITHNDARANVGIVGADNLNVFYDDFDHAEGNTDVETDLCVNTVGNGDVGADICTDSVEAGIGTSPAESDIGADNAGADICTDNVEANIGTDNDHDDETDICKETDRDGSCTNGAGHRDCSAEETDCVVIIMNIGDGLCEQDNNDRHEEKVSEDVQDTALDAVNSPNRPRRDVPQLNYHGYSSPEGECSNSSIIEELPKPYVSNKPIKRQQHGRSKVQVCNICGTRTRGDQKNREHMNVHTGEKPFACSVCGQCFSRKSERNYHFRKHGGDLYTCEVCGVGFTKAFTLKKHSTIHTGEKPYECSICGRKFRLKGDVATHVKTHNAEKPHLCSICGKRFCKVNYLRQHMIVHTREKPHLCLVCGKTFAQKSTLNDHTRMHENELLTCSFCGKTYRRRQSLSRHIRKEHKGN